jgi:hypothetical protein
MNKFAEALTVRAGEPLQDLFKRRIADPIGMNPAQWRWGNRGQQRDMMINGGAGNGNGHIFTSARELARFGLLFLNEGRWNGRQLVDSTWVREVTRPHVGSYGMNWWSNGIQSDGTRKWPHAPASTFAALGHNNNHLFVVPEWGVVIVRLGLDQKDVKMSDETWSEFFKRLGPGLTHARSAGSPPLPSGAVPVSSPAPAAKRADRETAQAARTPAALPTRTFAIGKGGPDGFMTVDAKGTIHAVYGGKYRTGPSPDKLGPEETITEIAPFNGVRVAVDGTGQPHVVFTAGATANAKRSYYTAKIDGRWIPPEKFADADELLDRGRAYVADIAVDETGHALVSFWVGRPTERRSEYENWSFYYRWRSAAGAWSEPRSLSAHWSSAAKVEFESRRGFLLLWQHRSVDWRIAGPVAAGGTFALERSIPTGSATLGSAVQNEGADFSMHPTGALVVAGNKREKFEGPVGIWATVGTRELLPPPIYLGSFPGTKRGSESGLHPVSAFDAETGHAFVSVLDAGTKRAVFTVHRPERGWVTHYTPILPSHPTPQGTLRQGPSIADTPGPGVLALVRDADQQWYIRHLLPEDAVAASAGN